jgi:HSP20 family protein
MYYNQSCAAKGERQEHRQRHLAARSIQRAPVSIYKTETSYEMLVFAPGRIREHFKLDVKGDELTVSYSPPEGFTRPEWVHREYSRGAFIRSFTLAEDADTQHITARYADGVLQVSVPIIPGKVTPHQTVTIN